jgi:hypothetical protein
MDGEISEFEKFLQTKQREQGLSGNDPLMSSERGILKAFIIYAKSRG